MAMRKRNVIPAGVISAAEYTAGSTVVGEVLSKLKGKGRKKRRNPLESASQYGLMQAVASGTAKIKGITQEIAEKLIRETPKGMRSKFAKELASRRRNPSADLSDEESLSKEFHGREPKEIIDVVERESYGNAVVIGDLWELGCLGSDNKTKWIIRFKKNRPILSCDSDGENLEVIGGDQVLEIDESKRKVPLGFGYMIVYETDKHHLEGSSGYPEPYEHFFGEEFYRSNGYKAEDYKRGEDFFDVVMKAGLVGQAIIQGYLPVIVYDRVDEKIELVGGKYKVEDVGIKD